MALIDTDELPSPDDLVACGHFKTANAAALTQIVGWVQVTSRRIKKHIEETGKPIGGMDLIHTGSWVYPPEIVDVAPQLGHNDYHFELGAEWDHGRVLEVLIEMLPELADELRRTWKVTTVVDKELCLKAIDNGGELGEIVRQLRSRPVKLGAMP